MIFTVTCIEKCSLHSASLGTDPSLLANHNPAIFSIPLGTEKLNKSPRQTKALIIPTCCTFLTILILILEQPTNVLIPSYVIQVI